MSDFQIKNFGDHRVLYIGEKQYTTVYSQKVIEKIIERKGVGRAPQYLTHRDERSRFLFPLFRYCAKEGLRDLRVLEVGCSSGHITEYLNQQPVVGEIYTYDVDPLFVEITRIKKEELRLEKVVSVDCFSNEQTRSLPYPDGFFDIIIVLAVVEHLPFENRYLYVDSYYKKLKKGGLIGFFDTPNRYFPIETHSIGLPFVHWLPPEIAYTYARLFRKAKGSFTSFTRTGNGWKNATYYECTPRTCMMDVEDISEDVGYGYHFFINDLRTVKAKITKPFFVMMRFLSQIMRVPTSFFLPSLELVFRKKHDYETGE